MNIQNGKYESVATPSTVDCVIPQEFQGISTDVTETESSIERPNNRGSSPNFIYKFLNRLAVMMIDRYWSPVQLFMNNPEPTVVVTAEDVFLTPFKHDFVRDDSMPVPSITPPKIIAQRIR